MLEGLLDPARWAATFANMAPFWDGFGVTLQVEAAQSQGFSRVQTYVYIVLPQTFKIILPPLCNQALNLVKNSSVLALVTGGDLMYRSDNFVSLYGYLRDTSCAASCTSSSASRWRYSHSISSAAARSARMPRTSAAS